MGNIFYYILMSHNSNQPKIIEELKEDINEIELLLTHTKRDNIRNKLNVILEESKSSLKYHLDSIPKTIENNIQITCNSKENIPTGENIAYNQISSYSWDQEDKSVKFYITLPGIEALGKENIIINIDKDNMDLRVHNLS